MTVEELIDRLKEFPLDTPVMTEDGERGGTFDIHEIYTRWDIGRPGGQDRLEVVLK